MLISFFVRVGEDEGYGPSTRYLWTAKTGRKLKVKKLNVTLYERNYFRNSFTLQSIEMISKNASNKSCLELNFPQKTQQTHISISRRSEVRGLRRFPFFHPTMY